MMATLTKKLVNCVKRKHQVQGYRYTKNLEETVKHAPYYLVFPRTIYLFII